MNAMVKMDGKPLPRAGVIETTKTHRRVPRQYPAGTARPSDATEPERYKGCPRFTVWQSKDTDERHYRQCNKCHGCRNYKHERIVGQALAECETAGVVLSLTLTYRDNPDGSTPDGAKRLVFQDVEKMLKRLRKDGYIFTKICAGEYGSLGGRAHYHILLMCEATNADDILRAIEHGAEPPKPDGAFAPPFVSNEKGNNCQAFIKNPDVLVCSIPARKQTVKIRNDWRYWPHGFVEAQLVKGPGCFDPEHIEGAVRYTIKYLSKDCWKDSKKFKDIPFENLPEHIKQQTRYGPWRTDEEREQGYADGVREGSVNALYPGHLKGSDHHKWRYGNEYVEKIKDELTQIYGDWRDAPVDEQPYVGRYNYKAKGGLGHRYYRALGVRDAKAGSIPANPRVYEHGANFVDQNTTRPTFGAYEIRRQRDGRSVVTTRRRHHRIMGRTGYRSYWAGINANRPEPVIGPDDCVERMETQDRKARDVSQGAFGYHLLKRLPKHREKQMLEHLIEQPVGAMNGLFPKAYIHQVEDFEPDVRWCLRSLARHMGDAQAQIDRHGEAEPEPVRWIHHQIKRLVRALERGKVSSENTLAIWKAVRSARDLVHGYDHPLWHKPPWETVDFIDMPDKRGPLIPLPPVSHLPEIDPHF